MESKYCLVTDSDGHWYVIPIDRQNEWSKWNECNDYTPLPKFADGVGGSPSLVEFEKYEIR